MLSVKRIYITVLLPFLIILGGCSLPKNTELANTLTLPQHYEKFGVDSSYKKPEWRKFYNDSNLVSLIDIALKDNLDLRIAVQRLEIASATYSQSRWLRLPSLALFGGAGKRKYGDYTMDGVGNFDTNLSQNIKPDQRVPKHVPDYKGGLETAWELDVWGKFKNMKKAAKARYLASEAGMNFYKTVLVSQIAFSYYELIALDKELEIVRNNIALQEKILDLIRAQKEGGLTNELAVSQVHAQLLNTRAIEYEILQVIRQEEIVLNTLLGRFPQEITRSNEFHTLVFNDSLSLGNPSDLLLFRPDVRQEELNLLASKADVKVARAAFMPRLTLVADWGVHSFKLSNLMSLPVSMAYGAAVGLVAPVFNRNEIRANFNIKKSEQLEALLTYQKTILTGYSEVLTHLYGIHNINKVAEYKAEEVAVLKQATVYASDLYATGNANYIEVITVQKNVLLAELELILSQKKAIFENIMLYKAIGGGWE